MTASRMRPRVLAVDSALARMVYPRTTFTLTTINTKAFRVNRRLSQSSGRTLLDAAHCQVEEIGRTGWIRRLEALAGLS